ncbi:MAG: DUF262 domain-containing protein [Planctomycetes bacterium]|nr:DUF262 domain-containing protein [Planctomycetota bacterium]
MSATNFKTENNTFRKLLGNGLTYRVPRFQRDYSWTETEWEDLWQDLLGTMSPGGEASHYMGYLVLQSTDDRTFDVIDGQQRLTTLSLIVLAALKGLQRRIDAGVDAERNKQRMEQLRQTYVGYLDPVTLVPRSKLTLNRNNDRYYQTFIVPLAARLPQHNVKASERTLRSAFEWFDRNVEAYVAASKSPDPGMTIAQLVDSMSDKLFFTVITVSDELNAYKVFETLNARGVRLSATDLLKNYLFSVLHRSDEHEVELAALDDRWEGIVGRLGAADLPEFLRVHWNSRHASARQSELFQVIRTRVTTRQQVFDLLRDMEADVDTYVALTQPETLGWSPTWREHVATLRMFSVRQPFPLLLAARRNLDDAEFERVLAACVTLSFRYNVIAGLHTADQERAYHSTAVGIATGRIRDARGTLDALRGIYVSDDNFQAAFADRALRTTAARNRKIVRYVLSRLERHVGGAAPDLDDPSVSVEHVLPEHPGQGWESFAGELHEAHVYRLGNMTLLAASTNRDVGNADFEAKRAVYGASAVQLTAKIAAEFTEWTPESIDRRQKQLARLAKAEWRIDQLS